MVVLPRQSMTAALILFIFAVTSGGSSAGWGSAMVIAPLISSVLMVCGFFCFEAVIPPETAAVPPRTWFLPNFGVLFGIALFPFLWWNTIFTLLTAVWQTIYHWSAISVAIRMFPLGAAALVVSTSGPLSNKISPKYVLMMGQGLLVIATILLALADTKEKYWSHVLPAFFLGSAGAMFTYMHTNIAIFRASPPAMAGTVGAIFNGALQLGSAVGIAATSSIQTSVDKRINDPSSYKGRAAAFWFLLGLVGLELLSLTAFYKVEAEHRPGVQDAEKGAAQDAASESGEAKGSTSTLIENVVAVTELPLQSPVLASPRSDSTVVGCDSRVKEVEEVV